MQNFEYCTPTKLYNGKGVVKKLPEALGAFGKKVLLTYGGGSVKRNGIYAAVKELLKGFEVVELGGIEPNPKYTSVLEGVALCKKHGIEVVLAVGGGSVLDCSKAIAAGAMYEGEPWDLITHRAETKAALPIVDVITMAATGSEYDPGGVISRTDTNDKIGYMDDHLYPAASFVDPTYTYTVPARQVAAGVADAFNHVMEQYFNADPNGLADGMMESVMKSLVKNGKTALDEPENYDVRAEIFLATTLACNGILSLGEAESGWPMHAMEHALSAYYDITHGVGLAILTPRWLKHILCGRTAPRIAQFGQNVFGVTGGSVMETAERTIEETYRFFVSLGLPMHLRDVGVDDARLGEMARHVAELEGLDEEWVYFPLREEDVLAIYRASL